MTGPVNVLVLGFYDRANLGDEIYKEAFRRIVPGARFVCTDDISQLDSKALKAFDFVVCGGGDIVNSYFMKKIKMLIKPLRMPCYAVSVGLPYPSDAHYFSLFDHVFVRSKSDAFYAIRELGAANVTCLPDLAFSVPLPPPLPATTGLPKGPIKIGVCLAQPMFYRGGSAPAEHLLQQMVRFLSTLVASMDAELYLLSFNSGGNPAESDVVLNQALATAYRRARSAPPARRLIVVDPQRTGTFDAMCQALRPMDVVIGSRYHSIVLAMALHKPFLAIYTSRKINNLLLDHDALDRGVRLHVDAQDQPTEFPVELMVDAAAEAFACRRPLFPTPRLWPKEVARQYAAELGRLWASRKRKSVNANTLSQVLGKLQTDGRSWEACAQHFATLLAAFLAAPPAPPQDLQALVHSAAYRERVATSEGALTVARIVCYAMTRNLTSPYLWGLLHKLDPSQVLDSARWIYADHHAHKASMPIAASLAPLPLPDPPKRELRHWVDLYYFQQSDFKGAHRSGWDYVTTALHAFEAEFYQRYPDLILDTYVDRTFHWGREVLALDQKLPYRKPWIGFVHHTFDESHSAYNCEALLRSPLFLESLTQCRGLLVLSQALHRQWMVRLSVLGRTEVPVFQLYHPTEFPDRRFSIWKFWRNPRPRLLQIGAWLRNPYALYDLPIPQNFPHIRRALQKTALRGRDMDQSFPPPYLHAWLTQRQQQHEIVKKGSEDALEGCRPSPLVPGGHAYMAGLVKSILEKNASVEVLPQVTNEAYDALLSENVVFLNLVDASAVNTVIECIVRNTPIYVNRLPALEEVLGHRYPGFYQNLPHAAQLIQTPGHILKTHMWLRFCVNKSRFRQSTFVRDFQAILSQTAT